MAGSWIKMGVGLRRHPKVVRIASALKADRLRVIGGLHAVWCVFDEHSSDGALPGYTPAIMDEEVGCKGFSAAMAAVGWLIVTDDGLQVPDYEEHNGPTAKRRAMESSRKAESRADAGDTRTKSERMADKPPKKSGQVSASDADKLRAREEKNREEEKDPHTPKGAKTAVSLKTWLESLEAEGVTPIPPDDPVFAYAASVGIPIDFLRLAWLEFRHRYGQPDAKRYRDWRAVFRKAVRGNWLKLWWLDAASQQYGLTTVGMQAKRAHEERIAA